MASSLKEKLKFSKFGKYAILLSLFLFCVLMFFACGGSGVKKITAINVEQKQLTMVIGDTEQLTLSIEPETASNAKLFFTSANGTIASVDQNGMVTAMSVGKTSITISAKDGGATTIVPVEVIAQQVVLEAPANLSFDGEKIVWDRVENNFGYQIVLNGQTYNQTLVTNFFTNFQLGVQYAVQVRALGNDKTHLTSELSEEFQFMQYSAPTITVESGVIEITPNSDCNAFQILLNGQTYKSRFTSTTYIIENTLDVGLYTFEVIALGDKTLNTYNSRLSNAISITKLASPQFAQIEDRILTFATITGAQGYKLKIVNNQTANETYQTVTEQNGVVFYDLGDDYEAGKYDVYVKALGDQRTTLDSDYSTQFAVDKLSQPQKLKISNGTLSWDEVESATGYVMSIVKDGQEILEENIPSANFNFASKYIEAGTYTVKVMATGSAIGDINRFINSTYSESIEIVKLSAPKNISISANMVQWERIGGVADYAVLIDDTTTLPIQSENYVSFEDTNYVTYPAKSYTLRVKAVGKEDNVIDSQFSNIFSFKKLSQVDTSFVTLNGGTVSWQGIEDALVYKVFVNGSQEPVVVSTNSMDFSSQDYEAGNYSIAIQAISTTSNALNGEKSQNITFEKLPAPSNFRLEGGVLHYAMPDNASYIGYNLKVGSSSYFNLSNECLDFDRYMSDDEIALVALQAIGDGQSTISSNFSQNISLHKNSSYLDLAIENGILSWTPKNGATSYEVKIDYQGLNGNSFTQTIDVGVDEPAMINLMVSDLFVSAGYYKISMRSVGTTTSIETGAMTYDVTSRMSSQVSTQKLDEIQNLGLTNGIVTWSPVMGVSYYEVVFDGISLGNCGVQTSYTVQGNQGQHTVRVFARGNQSSVLDAVNIDNTFTVTKLGNLFNFKLNGAIILWDKINNATTYDVIIRDSNDQIVKLEEQLTSTSYTVQGLKGGQTYYLKVRANGDNRTFASGDFGALSGSKAFEAKILDAPLAIQIVDSILYFNYVNNAKRYEVYINYNTTQDMQEILAVDGQTRASFNLANYLKGKTAGTYQIYICSTDDKTNQQYIDSALTNPISVTKLNVPVLSVVGGVINFTNINNASSYSIGVKSQSESDFTYFDVERNKSIFSFDKKFSAGSYVLSIQAVGDGKQTISGEFSNDFSIEKLATPVATVGDNHDLEVKNGQLVWNAIDNATLYKIDVYKFDSILGQFKEKPEYTQRLMPLAENTYLPTGTEGNYQISIQVIGDDTKYVTSDVYRYGQTLEKMRAPDNLHIELGQVAWSINANADDGYSMVINDKEFEVGKIVTYELSAENGFSGDMDYVIYVRTLGNSQTRLSSDLSNVMNAKKYGIQNPKVENGSIKWTATAVGNYNVVVKNLDDEEVENIETENINYVLEGLQSGHYIFKIRSLGSSYIVDAQGMLNSDFSDELLVYKMQAPENMKINSEFDAGSTEELLRVGYVEWDAVANATNYTLQVLFASSVLQDYELDNPYYNLTATTLYPANYEIVATSKGETVELDSLTYQCINSDKAVLNAYKLSKPLNLKVDNGVFYWDTPATIEGLDIEMQYIMYYNYANFDEEFDTTNIFAKYVGDKEFQTLFELGKYQLKVCAAGVNCIRSDVAEIEATYLFNLFKSGSGTESDPYVIEEFKENPGSVAEKTHTALSQLNYLNYLYDKHFILKENITIDTTFVTLGTKDADSFALLDGGYDFEGTLNGNNCTITFNTGESGLDAFGGAGSFGFISSIAKNGCIKNLRFDDFKVSGAYNRIGIVTADNYGLIDNVIVSSENEGITSSFNGANEVSYIGGIVGRNYATGVVKNSTSQIIIKAKNSRTFVYAGGIAGYNQGLLENCQTIALYSGGLPVVKQINGTIVGGIAGATYGDYAQIIGCVNMANVDAMENQGEYGSAGAISGGIVGVLNYVGANVENDFVNPAIVSCYNLGVVSALEGSSITSRAGGLVGNSEGGTVHSSYNAGDVYIYSARNEKFTINVGGIIGWNSNAEKSFVVNCYSLSMQGMPLSCTIGLQKSEMTVVTEEELKANTSDSESVINKLNSTYAKFAYSQGNYPKLLWQLS